MAGRNSRAFCVAVAWLLVVLTCTQAHTRFRRVRSVTYCLMRFMRADALPGATIGMTQPALTFMFWLAESYERKPSFSNRMYSKHIMCSTAHHGFSADLESI